MITTFLVTGLVFFVILTILVLIHELGHFTAARIIGVRVEEFGLGLPPKITGKKIGETEYTVNWLPIGGFVRLAGEDDPPSPEAMAGKRLPRYKRYFWARSKKERAVILSAGVLMNFVLAVAITGMLLVNGVHEPSGRVHIESVLSESPAEIAGIRKNDVILAIDDSAPKTPNEMIAYVNDHKGDEIVIAVSRNGELKHFTVIPRVQVPEGQGALGVGISDLERRRYSLAEAPGKALMVNLYRVRDMVASLATTVAGLIMLRAPAVEVAGPIGIAHVTGQAIQFGWEAVFELASILSLNLAVLNILPIPALDGGRLAFVFLEKALRRRVNPVFEQHAHQIGMLILIALIFLVSIQDILRLVRGG